MTNENGNPEDKVLRGDAAIAKWKEGKDKWNAWVADHPDWGVEFSGVDFSEHLEPGETVDFNRYHFPNGGVTFSHAQFGDRRVDFSFAQFGNGNVIFASVQFGMGRVVFQYARFGKGHVNFHKAQFGKGDVDFSLVHFGEGDVLFADAVFGEGDVDFVASRFHGTALFNGAQFGAGNVTFAGSRFGNRNVVFAGTKFGKGNVGFNKACFGGGDLLFKGADFGEGNLDFNRVRFGDGEVEFTESQFGNGSVDFSHSQFGEGFCLFINTQMESVQRLSFKFARWKGSVQFKPNIGKTCKIIDFSSASIEGELALGPIDTSCLIDLRHTKLAHPIDLDKVNISYRFREYPKRFFLMRLPIAYNPDASTCFRRLKKLAKDADDHERALDFFAKEMRSSYGRELRGWRLFLYLLYDNISDYGRSISIPAKWLCIMVQLYGLAYFLLSAFAAKNLYSMGESFGRLGSSLTFSLAHALPFYFGSREANADTMNSLFTVDPPDYLHWITISQGMVCGVLLFLIALALRNHFRS